MLFVFLALYVALGIGCIVAGIRRRARAAVTSGVVALALAAASLLVWILSTLGSSHWSVSILQILLSPMPESLVEPAAFAEVAPGIPSITLATIELVVAIGLWLIPVFGLVAAGRSPRRQAA
jgi:isoprenylcysteine carboxyl methyltransferase (ICMT) family protein YpbQ